MFLIGRIVDRFDTGADDQPTTLTALVRAWWTARRYWRGAETFADLADLAAGYLEGAVDRSPTHCGPPAAETASIVDRLAALNRTGLVVTYGSQPGEVDEYGRQRAFVEMFVADVETLRRVQEACQAASLWLTAPPALFAHPPGSRPPLRWSECRSVPVTEGHDGRVYTDVGGWMPPGDVAAFHRRAGCRMPAVGALLSCWQVEVYDPVWGRADLLWDTLADALAVDR